MKTLDFRSDSSDGKSVDILDVRNNEALGSIHGNTHVVCGTHDEAWAGGIGVCVDASVEDWVIVQGEGEGLDDEGEVG